MKIQNINEPPRGMRAVRVKSAERMKKVDQLRKEGYSQNQICRMLGFKSRASVQYYEKKLKK